MADNRQQIVTELNYLYHNRIWNNISSLANNNVDNMTNASNLRILHHNVKSLYRNLYFYESLNLHTSCDIFSVNESWLKPSIPDSLVSLDNFSIIRDDRKAETKSRGGGTALYIRSNLKFKTLHHLSSKLHGFCDSSVWVELFIGNTQSIVIASIYLTPDSNKLAFLEKLSALLSSPALLGKHKIIIGDFNINWNAPSNCKTLFEHSLQTYVLHQHSSGITFTSYLGNESLLDHNYVSDTLSVQQCKILTCDKCVSDHYATYLVVSTPKLKTVPRKLVLTRNFKKLDHPKFYNDACQLPLLEIAADNTISVHEKALRLDQSITDLLNLHVPPKQLRVRGFKKPWLTKDLFRLISLKNNFYKKIFRGPTKPSVNQRQHFCKFKNYVLNQIRKAKKTYYANKISESSSSFFTCLRDLTGKNHISSDIDHLLVYGQEVTNEIDIANTFNSFFTNIPGILSPTPEDLATLSAKQPSCDNTSENNLRFSQVSCEDIRKYILSLKPHKKVGLKRRLLLSTNYYLIS